MMILNTLEIHSKPLLRRKRPKVWVTAANSFIARNLLEQLDYDFTTTTHDQVDLANAKEVDSYLEDKYFDVIIHTACVGGRARGRDSQKIFDLNFNMFDNLKNNQNHYKYLINFGSGADQTQTWYGRAKRTIAMIIKEKPNMLNIRLYGVWGRYEAQDRFPTTVINSTIIDIEEKLMRYAHVDELVEVVDKVIGEWPKRKREITLGEPILLSDFAKQLKPGIKINIVEVGKDYV